MDFSNIFSSIKRQFVSESKENLIHLGSPENISNGNTTSDLNEDESYLIVNANLEIEVMDQSDPAFLPNDGQLLPSSASEGLHLQDSNSALSSHKNAISDVPFHLHNSLVTQQQINSLFTDTPLTQQSFDWGKYYVDFSYEQTVLSSYSTN